MTSSVFKVTNQPDIVIDIPDYVSNIYVQFSSGTDSSMMLYLICLTLEKYKRYDVKVIAGHGCQTDLTPSSEYAAKGMFSAIKEDFPNIDLDLYLFWFRAGNESKSDPIDYYEQKCMNENNSQMFWCGINRNPPMELKEQVFVSHNGKPGKQLGVRPERDMNVLSKKQTYAQWEERGLIVAKPIMYIHKKGIAELYSRYPTMQNKVLPLTESCVKTKLCKKCAGCEEKYWAFGHYDHLETA